MDHLVSLTTRVTLPMLGQKVRPAEKVLKHLLLAGLTECLLFGVITVQVVNYYKDFPRHDRVIRATVTIIFILNIVQLFSSSTSLVNIVLQFRTPQWLSYAATSPVVLLDHLTSPLLVAIPHILLIRKSVAFARSLESRRQKWITVFAWVLFFGAGACFITGSAAMITLFLQGRRWMGKIIPPNTIDYYSILLAVDLTCSAVVDVVLACTLTWELRNSNTGVFKGTNALLQGLIAILLANGVVLSGLQLAMCIIFLTARELPMGPAGLTILAKFYSITCLLIICRPLEIQRAAALALDNASTAAQISHGRYSDAVGPTTGLSSFIRRDSAAQPVLERNPESDEILEKALRTKPSTTFSDTPPSSPGTSLSVPSLYKNDVPLLELPSPPPRRQSSLTFSRPHDVQELDLNYILSETEPVALSRADRNHQKELSRFSFR
ncbi:hypothetical protein BDY24DRAFT_384412 [Mrakia frigida]|uniref:uncharacterized protein n=1 Tax=Mrakia frigida TaxID=29902 RepID=UPI003FCC20FF